MLHAIVPIVALACASFPSSPGSSPLLQQESEVVSAAKTSGDASGDKALGQIDEFIAAQKESGKIDVSKPRWKTSMPSPPELEFNAEMDYFWNLKTNKGDIKIRLMPGVAPMHVSSTIYLVRTGFYDGLIFHRVIPKFMAQGGCPLGRGTGSPGYQYDGETDPKVKHDRPGLLSMANAGPGTDGSQFFLTFVPTSHLDGKHTIFGEVVDGMPVVKALEAQGSAGRGTPKQRLEMIGSTITVEPKPAKAGARAQPTEKTE